MFVLIIQLHLIRVLSLVTIVLVTFGQSRSHRLVVLEHTSQEAVGTSLWITLFARRLDRCLQLI